MAHHLTTLPSGDEVGFSAAGDPLADRLVLFCLPTPGAGMFDPDPTVTSRWGVHLVVVDRPGYGSTEPGAGLGRPGSGGPGSGGREPDSAASSGSGSRGSGSAARRRATIQDRADDLAGWLRSSQNDARQSGATVFGPAGIVGWGTGGMVALSLAARHPELVDRVAAFQTASPHGLSFDPSIQAVAPFGSEALGIPADDPLLARPGLRNRLDRMLEEAALQGTAGTELDRQALADTSWAHELGAIQAEVRLIYADDMGQVDRNDGDWYRRRIRSSKVVRVSSGGALAIATQWDRILDFVAPDHGGLSEQSRLG